MTPYPVEPTNARPWSNEQLEALFSEGFPRFITADLEVKKYITRVREYFPQLDVMLVDEQEQPAATGWGVPISWSGELPDLPTSFADILRRAVEGHESGHAANTFVICGGVVHPALKGTGAATDLVRALSGTGQGLGLAHVLAPVRPTRKHLYPIFEIAEYAAWVRDDGLPFDPWLRLHVRAGGRIIAVAPAAQTMTGSVRDWEEWAGMALPATGEYVIPQGMGLLRIDLAANLGTYVEPNIWVQHR
jgi:hypothetical protein